jgi:hypothetical protein
MTQFHISQGSNDIEIEVISLEATTSFNSDDKNKLLFVEYSFLDYKGHLLETQSLPAPKKPNDLTVFRHVQKFVFDTLKHAKQIKILSSMLSNNSNTEPIKFYVVSESVENSNINKDDDDDDDLNNKQKECEEVG